MGAKRGRGARGRRRSGRVAAGHLQGHRYAAQSLWASLLCVGNAHGSTAGWPWTTPSLWGRPCRSGSGGTKSALRPKARGRLGCPIAHTEGQRAIVDLRRPQPLLRIVPEPCADLAQVAAGIECYWPGAFTIEFVDHEGFVRVGHRAKFRHVVAA